MNDDDQGVRPRPLRLSPVLSRRRPPDTWQRDAACRGMDRDVFFARGRAADDALATCQACPVRRQCLDHALTAFTSTEDFGIWGGTTEAERADMRRERKRVAA